MKNLKFLTKNLIAHRGCFDNKNIPENSMKAFELAIKNSYVIELDIHLLKDNTLVVFHDDNLNRMTGIDKAIKYYDYNELKEIKLLNTKCNIPTLNEVLELVNGKVPIIIEIKYDRKSFKIVKELFKILDNYKGKFAVKSFNSLFINYIKKHRPDYIRGLLIPYSHRNVLSYTRYKMIFLKVCKPDFISCNYKMFNNKKIKKFHKNNLVIAWTFKKQKIYLKYKKYFDNFICENLKEGELWKE